MRFSHKYDLQFKFVLPPPGKRASNVIIMTSALCFARIKSRDEQRAR